MSERESRKVRRAGKSEAHLSPIKPRNSKPTKDWRQTVGVFTDDDGMKQLFREALKIREEDRRQARARRNNRQNKKA
jgi:hypothetical protein